MAKKTQTPHFSLAVGVLFLRGVGVWIWPVVIISRDLPIWLLRMLLVVPLKLKICN
jgi:hypothetical protein